MTRSLCVAASTLCEDAGGLVGTAFGCEAKQSCFEGKCVSCTSENMAGAVECGAQGAFKVDLQLVNPSLETLKVCGLNLTFSTNVGCGLQWKPANGVGVDCANAPDGLLTANANETLKIALAPAINRLKLSFGSFVVGQDEGKVTVVLAGSRRRQATMEAVVFNQSSVVIDVLAVAAINVEATRGAFDVRTLESVEGTASNMSTTMVSNGTSATTMPVDAATSAAIEKGFIDRLNDGFAGNDDVYLGGFLTVVIVLLLMISACAVVALVFVRNRRRRAAAGSSGDGTELIKTDATTVPQLSAPYQSLPAAPADYDLLKSGAPPSSPPPGYDRVVDTQYNDIQLPTVQGYNAIPPLSSANSFSSVGSLNLPPPPQPHVYLTGSTGTADDIDRQLAMSFTREM